MEVLRQRQPDLTVVLDGVHKPHNLSAIVRTCDAVGVLDVHAVPRAGVSLPVLNSTAQGSGNWVVVHRHAGFADAHAAVRAAGCRTYAAHLSADAVDYRQVDFTQPTAIVLGAEKFGVDAETAAAVDGHIIIGMHGMVESLNVSVAAALILFEAERQRLQAGMYAASRLTPERFEQVRFEWLYPKLARFCRETGQPYPALDDQGELRGRVKGMPSASP